MMFENINEGLLDFLEKSPTAFHAVSNIRAALQASGYTELSESQKWELHRGGRYFTVRNESSVIAFRIPQEDYTHFMIAAAHSDSPSFKIKANPEVKAGPYVKLNVEKYGGMLIAPWFDRPLSVAGRLIVQDENGGLTTRLVNVDRDLLMLPSLAIHMDREANSGHAFNVQNEVMPLFGDETSAGHFMEIVAQAAGVKKEAILGDDLFLYARGRGTVFGANHEYLSAGHLDDLQCVYAALQGFIASGNSAEKGCRTAQGVLPVLAVFDNEEVGSGTKQGADSTFLEDVLRRINEVLGGGTEQLLRAVSSSFMVSADNAHAIHPNYPGKADPVNRPVMNRGIVIKYNANQKYTTDAVSAALFKMFCRRADVPFQEFTNRSDMAGGSTLGNISNAHVSLNTVDVGLPQLAMHSPYETAGVKDTAYLARVLFVIFRSGLSGGASGSYRL